MLRLAVVTAIGLAVAGCGVRREVQMQQDDQECQNMGAAPGSQPYLECRMRLRESREATKRAILSSPSNSTTCIRNGNVTNCF